MAIKVTVRKSSYKNIVPVRTFVRMPNMKEEIEKLFQENKDLKVAQSHLIDEIHSLARQNDLLRQQSEARRQVLCERDKTIQELEEKIADNCNHDNKNINHWMHTATIWREKAEALQEEREKLERQVEWLQTKNEEWAQVAVALKDTIAVQKEEKEALEDIIHAFEETRKDYEAEIHTQHVEKREWMQKYEELKAQKEADDKKSEEICTACNELYEDVLSDRNRLREEVARLTNERDIAIQEATEKMFDINDLQDSWEAEHNLRVEANRQVECWQKEARKLTDKVEELEAEVDACHHNIDGYIEGNRRMRAEYEKKLETEQGQTKYWRKKHDEVMEEYIELETDYDALAQTKREYGEEIDRLRKVVTELQTNRFTTDEFIGMIMKNFMPSADE